MAECTGCGITIICPGGCGQICLSDCTQCWGFCSNASFKEDSARDPLAGSESVKVCTHDLDPETLLAALQAYLGSRLAWTDVERKGPVDLSFSGTVDLLLDEVGLRRAGGQ
jgi:hypothetical protein